VISETLCFMTESVGVVRGRILDVSDTGGMKRDEHEAAIRSGAPVDAGLNDARASERASLLSTRDATAFWRVDREGAGHRELRSSRRVRTLVVSDLHLGSRLGHDVLRRDEALEALLGALDASIGWCCSGTSSSCSRAIRDA
jgi:hypothetical protein